MINSTMNFDNKVRSPFSQKALALLKRKYFKPQIQFHTMEYTIIFYGIIFCCCVMHTSKLEIRLEMKWCKNCHIFLSF